MFDAILKHRKKRKVFEKSAPLKWCDKEAITRNYDAYKPRLRRRKGVNIGGYDGELCVRKIRSIKSSVEPICGCHRTLAYVRDTFIHTAAHTRLTRLDALQIVDSHIYILITRLFHFLAVRTCYACVGTRPLVFLFFFHLLLVIISIFLQSYIKHF